MAIVDLSGWTKAGGATLTQGKYRARFTDLTRSETNGLWNTAAALGEDWSGDFEHHFAFEANALDASSIVFPWMLTKKEGNAYRANTSSAVYVGSSAADAGVYYNGAAWVYQDLTVEYGLIGNVNAGAYRCGHGMLFDTDIPEGARIVSVEFQYTGRQALSGTTCNGRIYGELAPTPGVFLAAASGGLTDYMDRRENHHTTNYATWASIPAWSVDECGADTICETSANFVALVQEIVSQSGFNGNIVLFADDYANESSSAAYRNAYAYDGTSTGTKRPKLTITYEPLVDAYVGVYMNNGVIYLGERYGTSVNDDAPYTIPTRYRYRPLQCKVARSSTTLTLDIYSDAAEEAANLLASMSMTLRSTETYTYIYLPNTYNDTGAQKVSGMVGQLYFETPPAYFSVLRNAIVWTPEDTDDMDGYLVDSPMGWTASNTGGTPTNEEYGPDGDGKYWAHLVGDGTNDAGAYAAVTTATKDTCMVGATIKLVTDGVFTTGETSMMFGVYGAATHIHTTITNTSGVYYWRLYRNTAYGALSGTQTTYVLSPTANVATTPAYNCVIACDGFNAFLWVQSDDDATYTNWTCVDNLNLGRTDGLQVDSNFNYARLGQYGALLHEVGDRYITDFKFVPFHVLATGPAALTRGGSGDGTMVLVVGYCTAHATADHYEIFTSTDDGVIWTSVLDPFAEVSVNAGIIWDGTQWVSWKQTGEMYTSPDLTTWTLAYTATLAYAYLTRLVEGGKFLGFGGAGTETGAWEFAKFDIVADSEESARIYCGNDILDWVCYEYYFWRRTSDNRLMAMGRYQDYEDGSRPSYNWIFECQDTFGAASEGVNKITGNATSYLENSLVDSGTDFVASGVQEGWSVWNTTTSKRGVVSSVAEHTLGIRALSQVAGTNGAATNLIFPDEGGGAQNDGYYLSCWGEPKDIAPHGGTVGNGDYDYKTAWLSCFKFSDYIYLGGANRRATNGAAYPPTLTGNYMDSAIAVKASAEDGQIICERAWDYAGGAYTAGFVLLETGNGSVDAANTPGNHYLDYYESLGIGLYMRLDVVDTLSPSWKKRRGITFTNYTKEMGRAITGLTAINGVGVR